MLRETTCIPRQPTPSKQRRQDQIHLRRAQETPGPPPPRLFPFGGMRARFASRWFAFLFAPPLAATVHGIFRPLSLSARWHSAGGPCCEGVHPRGLYYQHINIYRQEVRGHRAYWISTAFFSSVHNSSSPTFTTFCPKATVLEGGRKSCVPSSLLFRSGVE